MEQQIRFCTTVDGVRIAYATTGKGTPIVRPGHWLTHLEYDLKSPIWGHFIENLSEHHQLVRYDPRGTGCSERNVSEVSHELWGKDLEAVVDDLALDRFALLGVSQAGPTAIRYCVNFPDRVSHLILYGAWACLRLRHDPAYPTSNRPEMFEALCTMVRQGWGGNNEQYRELFSRSFVPGGSKEHIRFLNELEKISATPEMAEKYLRAIAATDVRSILPEVKVPTLVMHCQGDRSVGIKLGRELAAGIPGSKFISMEGDNHLFLEDEPAWQTFFSEVQRFLGDKPGMISKRALRRQARGFHSATQRLHHAIEPYYMVVAVASAVVGAISFVVTRLL